MNLIIHDSWLKNGTSKNQKWDIDHGFRMYKTWDFLEQKMGYKAKKMKNWTSKNQNLDIVYRI